MTALYIQRDYIKIDCDRCGDEVCLIKVTDAIHDNDTVRKPSVTICRECLRYVS